MNQFDRELDCLERQLDDGEINIADYDSELRELQRDYQAASEEASQRAHDDEMERW